MNEGEEGMNGYKEGMNEWMNVKEGESMNDLVW